MVFEYEKLRSLALSTAVSTDSSTSFTPRARDVFICTPSKCGTTMMQQIVHSLRTGGDMSFEEISLVIPFIDVHQGYTNSDLDCDQPGCLRAYKTHQVKRWCPGGFRDDCKYIYVFRNPEEQSEHVRALELVKDPCNMQVATSLFHYLEGWIFPWGAVTADEFVNNVILKAGDPRVQNERPSPWHHLLSWYPVHAAPNLLFLFYEDIVQHKSKCVRLVADFLGIPLNDALEEVVLQQTSKESMVANFSKYDDHPLKRNTNAAAGLPPDAGVGVGKVRGAPKAQLSEDTVAAIRQRWVDVLEAATGCASYGDFRRRTNAELGRPF